MFLAVAFVEGATRPQYDPVRMPISLLSLGELGWMQTANFLVFGGLMVGFAVGLARSTVREPGRSRSGPILIGAFALGILGAGLFAADPGGGYPPAVRSGSGTGTLHDVATLLVFVALIAAAAVFAKAFHRAGRKGWAAYSTITAGLVAVGFLLIFVAFNGTGGLSRVGGLIQRIAVLAGWVWLTLLAVDARSRLGPGRLERT